MQSLLNPTEISRQLRDWQQIAQAKALEQAGTAEGSAFLAESKRYGLAADCIEQQAELLAKEQQEHFLTKGSLMVRDAQLEGACKMSDDEYRFLDERGGWAKDTGLVLAFFAAMAVLLSLATWLVFRGF